MDSRPLLARLAGLRPGKGLVCAAVAFTAGAAAHLAWQSGLFANAALACLAAIWAVMLRPDIPAQEAFLPTPAGPSAREATELRQLRATLDQVPAPLLSLSPGAGLHALNRAARALFGTDGRVAAPDPGLLGAIAAAESGGRAVIRMPQAGGRSTAVSVAASFGPDGAHTLVVLRDVQAEMQEAEAAALRDLLAVLGHEIMNALTPVTSLAESAHALLPEDSSGSAGEAREALAIILRRAQGLDRFVQGYRALARVPPPMLRQSSAAQIIRDAAALFRARWASSGVTLLADTPAPDIMAALDASLVGQALLSLLTNAAEWALTAASAPRVWLHASQTNYGVAFHVRDNGPGVSSELAEMIFQPFFSNKPRGSGIGLSVARQIARSHGGDLALLPKTQPGAAFVMTF